MTAKRRPARGGTAPAPRAALLAAGHVEDAEDEGHDQRHLVQLVEPPRLPSVPLPPPPTRRRVILGAEGGRGDASLAPVTRWNAGTSGHNTFYTKDHAGGPLPCLLRPRSDVLDPTFLRATIIGAVVQRAREGGEERVRNLAGCEGGV